MRRIHLPGSFGFSGFRRARRGAARPSIHANKPLQRAEASGRKALRRDHADLLPRLGYQAASRSSLAGTLTGSDQNDCRSSSLTLCKSSGHSSDGAVVANATGAASMSVLCTGGSGGAAPGRAMMPGGLASCSNVPLGRSEGSCGGHLARTRPDANARRAFNPPARRIHEHLIRKESYVAVRERGASRPSHRS